MAQNQSLTLFLDGAPVVPELLGRDNREGSKSLDKILSLALRGGFQDFDDRDHGYGLARFAPPSVGGGLKTPRGGTPPPPHLCAGVLGAEMLSKIFVEYFRTGFRANAQYFCRGNLES